MGFSETSHDAAGTGVWRWGKAGERLTAAQILKRRHDRAYRRRRELIAAEESQRRAYEGWRLGYVAPWRITAALDAGGHEGAGVDAACGAEEPAVDEWEAGKRYPTFEQLQLLSELTGFSVDWFVRGDEPLDIRSTTMWGHLTAADRARWKPPVLLCDYGALEKCPGTAAYLETHLF